MKRMAEVQAAETKAGSSEERLTELPLPPEKLEPRARPHLSASKRSPVLRNAAGLDTEPSWLTFPVQVQACFLTVGEARLRRGEGGHSCLA